MSPQVDQQLSPNFWLREFLRSETATRMGRSIEQPTAVVIANLVRLCVEILEPMRDLAGGKAVSILSGWRPQWLNTAVGGSTRSDHMTGRASDLHVAGMSNIDVCRMLQASELPIRQCILEFPPAGWVHVSVGETLQQPKREFLTAVKNGKTTVYLQGIRD